VDAADRKIGLSRKRLHGGPPTEEEIAAEAAAPTTGQPASKPRDRELRRGTGRATGQLINMPEQPPK